MPVYPWPGQLCSTCPSPDDLFRVCSGSDHAEAVLLPAFPSSRIPAVAATACVVPFLLHPAAALGRMSPWHVKLQHLDLVAAVLLGVSSAVCTRQPLAASELTRFRLPACSSVHAWLLRQQTGSDSAPERLFAPDPVLHVSPVCVGALWPMPVWVWRDLRSRLFFVFRSNTYIVVGTSRDCVCTCSENAAAARIPLAQSSKMTSSAAPSTARPRCAVRHPLRPRCPGAVGRGQARTLSCRRQSIRTALANSKANSKGTSPREAVPGPERPLSTPSVSVPL